MRAVLSAVLIGAIAHSATGASLAAISKLHTGGGICRVTALAVMALNVQVFSALQKTAVPSDAIAAAAAQSSAHAPSVAMPPSNHTSPIAPIATVSTTANAVQSVVGLSAAPSSQPPHGATVSALRALSAKDSPHHAVAVPMPPAKRALSKVARAQLSHKRAVALARGAA